MKGKEREIFLDRCLKHVLWMMFRYNLICSILGA